MLFLSSARAQDCPQTALQALVMLSSFFLCMLYAGLVLPMIYEGKFDFKEMMSLQGVAKLMSTYRAVLPSWVSFGMVVHLLEQSRP